MSLSVKETQLEPGRQKPDSLITSVWESDCCASLMCNPTQFCIRKLPQPLPHLLFLHKIMDQLLLITALLKNAFRLFFMLLPGNGFVSCFSLVIKLTLTCLMKLHYYIFIAYLHKVLT